MMTIEASSNSSAAICPVALPPPALLLRYPPQHERDRNRSSRFLISSGTGHPSRTLDSQTLRGETRVIDAVADKQDFAPGHTHVENETARMPGVPQRDEASTGVELSAFSPPEEGAGA